MLFIYISVSFSSHFFKQSFTKNSIIIIWRRWIITWWGTKWYCMEMWSFSSQRAQHHLSHCNIWCNHHLQLPDLSAELSMTVTQIRVIMLKVCVEPAQHLTGYFLFIILQLNSDSVKVENGMDVLSEGDSADTKSNNEVYTSLLTFPMQKAEPEVGHVFFFEILY